MHRSSSSDPPCRCLRPSLRTQSPQIPSRSRTQHCRSPHFPPLQIPPRPAPHCLRCRHFHFPPRCPNLRCPRCPPRSHCPRCRRRPPSPESSEAPCPPPSCCGCTRQRARTTRLQARASSSQRSFYADALAAIGPRIFPPLISRHRLPDTDHRSGDSARSDAAAIAGAIPVSPPHIARCGRPALRNPRGYRGRRDSRARAPTRSAANRDGFGAARDNLPQVRAW